MHLGRVWFPQNHREYLVFCLAEQGGFNGSCSDLAPIITVGAGMPSPVSTLAFVGDTYLLPREKSLHREEMARVRKL